MQSNKQRALDRSRSVSREGDATMRPDSSMPCPHRLSQSADSCPHRCNQSHNSPHRYLQSTTSGCTDHTKSYASFPAGAKRSHVSAAETSTVGSRSSNRSSVVMKQGRMFSNSQVKNDIQRTPEIQLSAPRKYVVAQVLNTWVNCVLVPEPRFRSVDEAPVILGVSTESALQYVSTTERHQQQAIPRLCVLDELTVYSYRRIIRNGEVLSLQFSNNTDVAKVMTSSLPRPNAVIGRAQLNLDERRHVRILPAVIQNCCINKNRTPHRISILCVSRYHEEQERIREYQIAQRERLLVTDAAQLANTVQVVLPPGTQYSKYFVLPRNFPKVKGTTYVTEQDRESRIALLTPVAHQSQIPHNITSLHGSEVTNDQLRMYEDTLLAASAYIKNRVIQAMKSAVYQGTELTWENDKLTFVAQPPESARLLAMRLRFWQKDSFMEVALAQVQEGTEAPEDPLDKAFNEAVIRGVLTAISVDEIGTVSAELSFPPNMVSRVNKLCWTVLEKRRPFTVRPHIGRTGFEFRLKQMRYYSISNAIIHGRVNQPVVEALLGIGEPKSTQTDSQEVYEVPKEVNGGRLTDEQNQVLSALSGGYAVLFQQAPAGTGKTHVIAKYVAMLFGKRAAPEVILVVAPTNLAVINLANAIFETAGLVEKDLIFLQSLSAERLYPKWNDEGLNLWKESRIPELLSMQYVEGRIEAAQRPFVEKYLEKRLPHTGNGDDEGLALSIALDTVQSTPKILVGTIAMAEQFYNRISQNVTYVICDEAGQVAESQMMTFASSFPNLRQLFLTGDAKQLPAYKANYPEGIVPYGHRSIVESILDRRMVPMISLNRSFRSHPILTACLSHASYDDRLLPAVNPVDRTILTGSPVQLPIQTCPLVLIHDDTMDVLDLCMSRYNQGHHQIAQKILDAMATCSLPEHTTTVVLCFYLGMKTVLLKKLRLPKNCEVHTIDSYQGREADIVILATTRTTSDLDASPEALRFFHHDERITVALSRARHGLFIIANFRLLERHPLWRRYLDRASQSTPVVTAEYAMCLNSRVRMANGVLGTQDGVSILEEGIEINDKWK